MVSVSDMLRWRLPPILIAIVLILQFLRGEQRTRLLDFAEIFAGQAEVSKALRRAPGIENFHLSVVHSRVDTMEWPLTLTTTAPRRICFAPLAICSLASSFLSLL